MFLVLGALGLIVYWALYRLSSRFREAAAMKRQKMTPEQQKAALKKFGKELVSEVIVKWALIPLVGLLWKWRNAPDGSIQHTVWLIALAMTIALGLWIMLDRLSRKMNGPDVVIPKVEDGEFEVENEEQTYIVGSYSNSGFFRAGIPRDDSREAGQ